MYLVNVPEDFNTNVGYFRDHLIHLLETRGIEFMISYVKASRNCVMRSISGEPLSECPGVELKSGLPKWLSPFFPLLDSSEGIKALLTLLTLTRAMTLTPSVDLATIEDPWKGVDDISDVELKTALKALRIHPGTVGE